jgi:hypothetical protein
LSDAVRDYAKLLRDGKLLFHLSFQTMHDIDAFASQLGQLADRDGIRFEASYDYDHHWDYVWAEFKIVHGV